MSAPWFGNDEYLRDTGGRTHPGGLSRTHVWVCQASAVSTMTYAVRRAGWRCGVYPFEVCRNALEQK